MASNKSKHSSKALAQSKRARRQWLTFLRMIRYGVNNFSRNAWLTVAATAIMTITLLIIAFSLVSRQVLLDRVAKVQEKVDMSIYLKRDTPDSEADKIVSRLQDLTSVKEVSYKNSAQIREDYAEQNKSNPIALEALNASNNKFNSTIRVSLKNINDTRQLEDFTKTDTGLGKYLNPDVAPSFEGSRRNVIKNLASSIDFAQKLGIGASVIFVIISSLIIFNTIRMAIFNRKDEIEMMKLIGANKGFIRGPFVIEAMVYGIVAGVIATILGYIALQLSISSLDKVGIAVQATAAFITLNIPFVLLGMVLLGALIGAVSSLLATRRYLKI